MFQKSIINSVKQDESLIASRWALYKKFLAKVEYIKTVKEDMTIFFITGKNLKYLLALLNSKLIFWYFNLICAESGVGTNRWKKTYVEQIPIPKIDEESQKPFINLVDKILEAKQKIKDYKSLLDEAIKNNNFDREIALKKELENLYNICITNQKTIDQMVYKLYELTENEIKMVERK